MPKSRQLLWQKDWLPINYAKMKSFSTNKFYHGSEDYNDENNGKPYTKYPIGYHSNGVKAFSKKDSWRKPDRFEVDSLSILFYSKSSDESFEKALKMLQNAPSDSMDGWMNFGQNDSNQLSGKSNE